LERTAGRPVEQLREPPRVTGHPVVGHTLMFARDPVALLRRGLADHGRIFSIRLAGKPGVVLLGPEYNRFFFEQTDKLLSIREAYPFFRKMFHENLYFFADPPEYKEQRKILVPPFQGRKLAEYVSSMNREVQKFCEELGDAGEFDVAPTFARLIMDINASSLLGTDCRVELSPSFLPEFHKFRQGTEFVLPLWFPIPRLLRSQQAKKRLHRMLGDMLARRRAHPVEPADFIQRIAETHYSDGRPVPDVIRINMILVLLWGGYETTTGQLSWALIELLRHPEYLRSVVAERDGLLGAEQAPDLGVVGNLELLRRGVEESMRLNPMAFMVMRSAAEDFELDGYRISKGTLVLASPAVSQRLPDVFSQPDDFDPERFSPQRAEDRDWYNIIGFGGGLHRCVGMHYAGLVMKIVISTLLGKYELELLDPAPEKGGGAKPRWPVSPCRVRYRRRAVNQHDGA
jgi:sterol 14alpha-demethylase